MPVPFEGGHESILALADRHPAGASVPVGVARTGIAVSVGVEVQILPKLVSGATLGASHVQRSLFECRVVSLPVPRVVYLTVAVQVVAQPVELRQRHDLDQSVVVGVIVPGSDPHRNRKGLHRAQSPRIGRTHRHRRKDGRRRRQRQAGPRHADRDPLGVVREGRIGQGVIVRIIEGTRHVDRHGRVIRRQSPVWQRARGLRSLVTVRCSHRDRGHRTRRHHDPGAGIAVHPLGLYVEGRSAHCRAQGRERDVTGAAGCLQHQGRNPSRVRRRIRRSRE